MKEYESEELIQEKIRQRVLEEYRKRTKNEELKLQTEATIDALHEITGISKQDIQHIADQVRAETEVTPNSHKPISHLAKFRKSILTVALSLIAALLLFNSPFFKRFSARYLTPVFKDVQITKERQVPTRKRTDSASHRHRARGRRNMNN